MIRECQQSDSSSICRIYNYYIENSICTFETEPVSSEVINSRIINYKKNNPWFVYEKNNRIMGYAYSRDWNPRAAYSKTKEVSIYIDHNCNCKGIGTELYTVFFNDLEKYCHALIAVITIPNPESVYFHEKFGFEKVGHFREVGYKFNKWLDVGYWELIM